MEGKILEVLGKDAWSADSLKRETLWTGTDQELIELLQDMAEKKLVDLRRLGALMGGRRMDIERLYVKALSG